MWTDVAADALRRLTDARADRRPCPPVRDLLPPDDVEAAYAVQSAWVAERVAAGARVVGRKIGLTNPAVQAQLGVDRPDFGALLDDMARPPGLPIDPRPLLQPRIEAEIAFVLAVDLTAERIGVADVEAATAHVVAALEIVDSRIADWDIGIVDTIADNASAGLFVLGETPRTLGEVHLPSCLMTLRRNGDIVSRGSGAQCLGDPRAAVAWLATTMRERGEPLRAGDVVLSGALGPVVPVTPGDAFAAFISGVGEVAVSFAGVSGRAGRAVP